MIPEDKSKQSPRNLIDYLNDAECMIGIYTNPTLSKKKNPGNYFFFRENLLKQYLVIRKYTSKELGFICQVLSSKVDYNSRRKTFKHLIKEIIDDLKALSETSLPFTNMPPDGTYVSDKEKFLQAETWAYYKGLLDEEGKWLSKKGYLSGFLNELIDRGIIRKMTVDKLDPYIDERYKNGKLDSLLKRSKGIEHYKLFTELEELLDKPILADESTKD